MKKFVTSVSVLAFAVLVTASASTVHAGYGQAGCGLGSLIIKGQGMVQIFAATTNGTFATQTFGITSGTSNCTGGGVVKADHEQEAFVEANRDNLSADMAAGNGQYLEAFAELLGCDASVKPALYSYTQKHFEAIVPANADSADELLYVYKYNLAQNDSFATNCARL